MKLRKLVKVIFYLHRIQYFIYQNYRADTQGHGCLSLEHTRITRRNGLVVKLTNEKLEEGEGLLKFLFCQAFLE